MGFSQSHSPSSSLSDSASESHPRHSNCNGSNGSVFAATTTDRNRFEPFRSERATYKRANDGDNMQSNDGDSSSSCRVLFSQAVFCTSSADKSFAATEPLVDMGEMRDDGKYILLLYHSNIYSFLLTNQTARRVCFCKNLFSSYKGQNWMFCAAAITSPQRQCQWLPRLPRVWDERHVRLILRQRVWLVRA